jgi:DNA-binding transcriptional MerR regulator
MSTPTSSRRLLNRRAVGQRYGGKHPRTIRRWKDAGVIPPPDAVVNGREYWDEDKLDCHDRQRVAELAAASSGTPRTP